MSNQSLEKLRKALAEAHAFQPATGLGASLGSGHVQTLVGHFLPANKQKDAEGERIEVEMGDGDTLVGFLSQPISASETKVKSKTPAGVIHIFHGLAGSSESKYVPRAALSAQELGFITVLWNHRGCGAGRGLALEPYHSGRSDDMARVVKWSREKWGSGADFRHGVIGYSLSANAVCLLAAQVVPAIDTSPLSKFEFEKTVGGALPDFAIAINPPFDLEKASHRLSHGPSRVYGQSFMGALLQSLEDRLNWQPESERRRTIKNLAVRARKKLNPLTNVKTFDATYTGPAGGFRDHHDYYSRASAGHYVHLTKIPLVVLTAEDDPITHGLKDLTTQQRQQIEKSDAVIDSQMSGGHMGYVDNQTVKSSLLPGTDKQMRWLEQRIGLYLHAFSSGPIARSVLLVMFVIFSSGCSALDAWKTGIGPSDAEYTEGRLADCPDKPNCISTQTGNIEHRIVPFTYSKPMAEAREALKKEMAKVPRAVLIKEDGAYLHFECRSPVLRVVDDVEFFFNDESKTLQFRSASRFGYSDWGANRKRMEDIRNKILGHI